ncbi:unnamed protein product [Gulo gulo]|uniref:Uncharacterized protein n=1 Tax=Gulo gulo TaxID=48420 RepID=A0A9X9LIC2_GULGU|nr:unnamed protein product [Gulo gulo]
MYALALPSYLLSLKRLRRRELLLKFTQLVSDTILARSQLSPLSPPHLHPQATTDPLSVTIDYFPRI